MKRGGELIAWLRALRDDDADAEVERALGIPEREPAPPLGEGLVGYFPSGAKAILQAIELVPIRATDVVIDLGAGLGKVLLLIHLATAARCIGIELQRDLVEQARATAKRLDIDDAAVRFEAGDVREADALLREGTVFYFYTPFHGPVLEAVLHQLEHVAAKKQITIATLGIDIERSSGRPRAWLKRRVTESFWLAVYDTLPTNPDRL